MHRDVNETLSVAKPVFPFGAAAAPQHPYSFPKPPVGSLTRFIILILGSPRLSLLTVPSNSQKREDGCRRDADTLQLGK